MATQNATAGAVNQPQESERQHLPLGSVARDVSAPIFSSTPLWWWIGFFISGGLLAVFTVTLGAISVIGVGLWDINNPVVWGVGIINLIFWIGIGHAGTFISAVLLLLRQKWRSAFSRFAEGMTLMAVAVAGLMPIFHAGRPWFVYWLLPYPNTLGLNPQWTSALVWDVVAISTYGLVSLLFWYIDLLPDFAIMRDKSQTKFAKVTYGILSFGWRGESKQWHMLHKVSYLLAALATPLVISVHSIVGLDFAMGNLPAWHHTIFPPYFVAGAVFSGFSMVIIVAIALRNQFGWQHLITQRHIDFAAKFVLGTGMLVGYGYLIEAFGAWYAGHPGEIIATNGRMFGPTAPLYWAMIFFNVGAIQLLWFKSVRENHALLIAICIGVLIGMWLERYVIIAVGLNYGHMVAMQEAWIPTVFDWLTIISPFGLFGTLFFLFIRFFPALPMFEVQEIGYEEGWR